jgi:hypothetical protein
MDVGAGIGFAKRRGRFQASDLQRNEGMVLLG